METIAPKRPRVSPAPVLQRGVALRALAFAAVVALVAAVVAACGGPRTSPAASPAVAAATGEPGSALPSPGPSGSAVAGSPAATGGGGGTGASPAATGAWSEGTVEQPVDVGSAAGSSGVFCSPCHVAQETSLTAVAARRQTLVAVGMQFPPAHAAAWVSTDGLRWQRATDLVAPAGSVMSAVTATGAGFVAVGNAGAAAAAWTSADGRTWSAASVAGGAAPAEGAVVRMHAVTAGPAGLVAAGEVSGGAGGQRAAFWTSPDGRAWTRVADQPSFAGGSVSGISAAGSRLVAVGTVNVAGVTWAATWSSADGRTWLPGTRDPSFRDAQLRGVGAGGPGFVAVGTADGETRAAAWRSADGTRWVPATDGGAAFTDYGLRIAMDCVTWSGAGFVASGLRDSAGNGSGVVWASPDGATWRRLPAANSFEGAEMAGVVAAAPGVVAVGAIGLPDQWTASVWVAAPPG